MRLNEQILDRFSDDELLDILSFGNFININRETVENELKKRLENKITNKVLINKLCDITQILRFYEDSYDVIILKNSDNEVDTRIVEIYMRTKIKDYLRINIENFTETDIETWNKYYNLYLAMNDLVNNIDKKY